MNNKNLIIVASLGVTLLYFFSKRRNPGEGDEPMEWPWSSEDIEAAKKREEAKPRDSQGKLEKYLEFLEADAEEWENE